jgi:hypothetical protein
VPWVLGQQVMPELLNSVPKVSWPFEPALAVVKVWSYRVTGKGSVIVVLQLSQWLPMSVAAGTNVEPDKAKVYDDTQSPAGVPVKPNIWPGEIVLLPPGPLDVWGNRDAGKRDTLAGCVCSPLLRCASANGIANVARTESRMKAAGRICALMHEVVGFII